MANKSTKKAKQTTKTLQRRPLDKPGLPVKTGVRAGPGNANNGEGWSQSGG
jgi:hypothetical protein